MPDELLLDHDPISGMTEWISTDEETGETFIRYEQDVSPILDYNKEMQAETRRNICFTTRLSIAVRPVPPCASR
ncbi:MULTISPECIES: hypothetical protein [unclassified Sphingopyxis]|uniref:hypothetical protein n=1 Tax=unclassified Sphingopyxis TaxID=2614943 RepID=UPI0007316AA6|nr:MULTISPECIES: hypothetical protein [unclassified Sphingopyxis]KTE23142.1 hypothetical protein ATE61_17805 [Sphingopyxis sp. H057]KTE48481.1 hypothetical protein ATE64_20645 [Sphingopyxis sp. H073]KTE50080.1 hypothetical protein ATE69_18600 [Sphingopyxis sp. H071]KTE58513.1 hypothetical protein ATE66_15140 [Sphingopyxis sp. H107]KTE63212.1 hypothetical protein ATE65_16265 [Sphingopyxis sp. H100]